MTYILGIHFTSHDSSACLLKDGELVGFVEEERLNRIKHTIEFPERSILYLLNKEGIDLSAIDYLAVPTTEHSPPFTTFAKNIGFGVRGAMVLAKTNLRSRIRHGSILKKFRKRLTGDCKVVKVDHHLSHLANAFFVSPFEKATIFSIDGSGDGLSSRLAYGEGNTIKQLGSISFPDSMGLVYYLVSRHLGFSWDSGEGKVMGLSSYGDSERYINTFRDLVKFGKNGSYKLNMKYFQVTREGFLGGTIRFSKHFQNRFVPPRKSEDKEPFSQEHMDLAAGLQKITEETVFHVLEHLYQQTKCENLALSGGVALNSVMNGKLHRQTPFKNIFIQPIAYDGGNAMGSAFYIWNSILNKPRNYVFNSCYLGPEFSGSDIKSVLDEMKLKYEMIDDPSIVAAKLIAQGNIVGWFQGKMEAGARALGNRSILADPRRAEMKDIVNKHVKHREPFRPFAPAILEEKTGEYFEDDLPVSFMERVFNVRPDKISKIPAVTHVDGTGRLQTVKYDENPRYYDLIANFDKITGVPVVLNTSFNIRGEPIVCTPTDAIRCFYSTGMDCLIIDKFLLKK